MTNQLIKKSFKYVLNKKNHTQVDLEILVVNGQKTISKITLLSNWRAHYPENPKIVKSPKGELAFEKNGLIITNGDITQMIKKIHDIVENI